MTKAKTKTGKRDPSDRERAAIDAARSSLDQRPIRAEMAIEAKTKGTINAGPMHNDDRGAAALINDTFASSSNDFVNQAVTHLANTTTGHDGAASQQGVNSGMALIGAIAPRDELEAALAMQMVATHEMAMMLAIRCRQTQRPDLLKEYGNLATKMSRTFTTQIKALSDMRRGGEQVVRHIHVHEGGQAVVAETVNVGGQNANTIGQPHALGPALLGQDTAGYGLPIPSSARAEAVPHARWQEPRRAKGQQAQP